jgi:hypothetical protein
MTTKDRAVDLPTSGAVFNAFLPKLPWSMSA